MGSLGDLEKFRNLRLLCPQATTFFEFGLYVTLFKYRYLDGNHKLIEPYRIVIHGRIDGYSRLIVFLHASSNNKADTVLQSFLNAVQQYNLLSHVRTDMGMENVDVARVMLERCGLNTGCIITGTSVHNQRFERLWREVNRIVCSRFVNIFSYLERNGLFNPLSDIHLWSVHVVYLPLINKALQELICSWNHHPVTTECNYRSTFILLCRMYCKAITNLIYPIVVSTKKGLCQVYKQTTMWWFQKMNFSQVNTPYNKFRKFCLLWMKSKIWMVF